MSGPFKMKGWNGFSPLKQKEDMGLVHGTSYMESKNPDPNTTRKGARQNPDGSRSTHLMADNDKNEAWPTLFQDKGGNWYEGGYDEAKRKGEIYKFDTREETINFARKGNWKK